jgi:hypothetical protein
MRGYLVDIESDAVRAAPGPWKVTVIDWYASEISSR